MLTHEEIIKAFDDHRGLEYPEDCRRIRDVILKKFGVSISLGQAQMFWRDHSTNFCAGWLFLPTEDDEIVREFEYYVSRQQ